MRIFRLSLVLVPAFGPFSAAWAWKEQQALDSIMAHSPLLRA